jgi:hypothetical protein
MKEIDNQIWLESNDPAKLKIYCRELLNELVRKKVSMAIIVPAVLKASKKAWSDKFFIEYAKMKHLKKVKL